MIGASIYALLWSETIEHALEQTAAAGFRSVELMASRPHASPYETDRATRLQLAAKLLALGLNGVSLNSPTLDLNLAAVERPLRDAAVAHYLAVIHLAADLGVPRVVVSPGRLHPLQAPPIMAMREVALDSVRRLVSAASDAGVSLALENLPFGLFERAADVAWMIDQIGSPTLSMTFDVANAHGVEDPIAALRENASYVSLIQLSDSRADHWMHAELGAGEIDFGAIWPEVARHGAPVILEVTQPPTIEAMVRSRALLASFSSASATGASG